MDLITLGRTLGFSFAAGVNLYATVAILGLAARYGWVDLPAQFQSFNHPVVIGAAIVMYLIEFFADKIPRRHGVGPDLHRDPPSWRRLIAVTTLGDASTPVEGLVALLGGTVAGEQSSHQDEHSRGRQHQPEPVSNWILSFGEDLFVVGLAYRFGASHCGAGHRRHPACVDRVLCSRDHPNGAAMVRAAPGAGHVMPLVRAEISEIRRKRMGRGDAAKKPCLRSCSVSPLLRGEPFLRRLSVIATSSESNSESDAHFIAAQRITERQRIDPGVREHTPVAAPMSATNAPP